ncbi:H-NS histone family protein [Chromobacterium violaceum]|uniref:DNA binding protein, nucleoid-associated n=2 Tax=Chromobacterium violaceum TaxID=536 RepID=A0A1R0MBF2_CHRVL|nr:H-NS histone family protein [Chromobacterium violaceum]AAQ59038.1 probable trans-acting regulatory HvrA protein [Chromobacterium violaceum ATCC 12472]ATP28029.1 KorB protein [Chromobacterium violaceum]ATP31939.1 KorB protein [Chromobacterium violaceum]KJH67274.1 KorB protein [Chromobacterium violaceum]KMN48395.1 KorB protein [Chromobacterium violaceum]
MDLSKLEFTELVALKADVENEIKRREVEEKSKAKKQIIELARAYGLSVEDVLSKAVAVRKPVEAKYRHPSDSNLTWTGRGRKPAWVQAWIDSGKKLEALAI